MDWTRERELGIKVRKVEESKLMVKMETFTLSGQMYDLIDFPKTPPWLLWG